MIFSGVQFAKLQQCRAELPAGTLAKRFSQKKQERWEQWDGQAQVGPGTPLVLQRYRPPLVMPEGAGVGGQREEMTGRLWTWREMSPHMLE